MADKPKRAQRPIKWREKDEIALKKAVRNFNDKIRRLEKKYKKVEDRKERELLLKSLPAKASYKELRKEIIDTRSGFNFEMKSLKSFTNTKGKKKPEALVKVPGNKNKLMITNWQLKDMKKRERRANIERKSRLQAILEMPATSRGEELGYTVGELLGYNPDSKVGMGDQRLKEYTPINAFTSSQEIRDIRKKSKTLLKETQGSYWDKKGELWRANYTRSLLDELGSVPEVEEIVEKIRGLPIEEFLAVMYSDPGVQETHYFKNKDDRSKAINTLKSTWLKNADIY